MDGTEVGIVHSPHPAQSTGHQACRRLLGCTLFRWEYPQSIVMVSSSGRLDRLGGGCGGEAKSGARHPWHNRSTFATLYAKTVY